MNEGDRARCLVGVRLGLLLAPLAIAGCARHVVVHPRDVPARNSHDWQIHWVRPAATAPAATPTAERTQEVDGPAPKSEAKP
jgi:hypothetical protein